MKIFIDRQLGHVSADFFSSQEHQIYLGWASLLELLGFGSLFSPLPPFDETHPLFVATVATLKTQKEKEVVEYIYDRLFAECLQQIQALEQMDVTCLLEAIRKQPKPAAFTESLAVYESFFVENPSFAMHGLILYLAWDRMCVWLGRLFDYPSTDLTFIQGIALLRECLIESYQHIVSQQRTVPSLFRMFEALFFYEMREENLNTHTEADFSLLSRSFAVLTPTDKLVDADYIDYAVTIDPFCENAACYSNSLEHVDAKVSFAGWMIKRLSAEFPEWKYILNTPQVVVLS